MKIVIDIDDNEYTKIKEYPKDVTSYPITLHIYDAIRKGIPLPEVHGRLIDADSLIKALEEKSKRLRNADTINGLCGAVALIFDEQTIIEADKEVENAKE